MEQGWSKLNILYQANPEGWLVLGVLVVIALLLCLPWRKKNSGVKMLRTVRREHVEQQAIDDFVSAIEERVYNGTYSRDEAKELHRKLKLAFPVRDLFPNPELLKEAILRRKALGIHDPVPLPPAMPELLKPRPKHMFDKLATT